VSDRDVQRDLDTSFGRHGPTSAPECALRKEA
jgi:hypothetical protein